MGIQVLLIPNNASSANWIVFLSLKKILEWINGTAVHRLYRIFLFGNRMFIWVILPQGYVIYRSYHIFIFWSILK